MKNCEFRLIFTFLLLCIMFSYTSFKSTNPNYHPYLKKLNVGSITLAGLLKRLGSKYSFVKLSLAIERNCPNGKLIKKWLNLIRVYRRLIIQSNQYPYYLKKYWHLNYRNRMDLFRGFLKPIIICGVFRGYDKVIRRKIVRAFYQCMYLPKGKLFKFTRHLKKIFLRRKTIKSIKDNRTIYKYSLIKKMIRLKHIHNKCIHYRKLCLIFSYRCGYFRGICDKFNKRRRKINLKVKMTFSNYFSIVLYKILKYMNTNKFKRHFSILKFNKMRRLPKKSSFA